MMLALTLVLGSSAIAVQDPIFPKVKSGGDLGTQRYRLFSAIEEVAVKNLDSNYFGYLWQGDEGGGPTFFLFPVGESNRVFFFTEYMRRSYGGAGGFAKGTQLVTSFELQKDGRPKRQWQVKTVWSKPDKSSPRGALAHFCQLVMGERLPNGSNIDYQLWTNKTTTFAKYYINRFNQNVVASFVHPNGHEDNEDDPYRDLHVDLKSVSREGLPICRQEIAALKKR